MKKHLFFWALCALFHLGQSQEASLLRFPALAPDGQSLAFAYQGDIFISTQGQAPRRLTIHEAYESHPLFSPSGDSLAFISNRYGSKDIFVMPASGGTPRRLTFHSASDNLSDWSRQGHLLFSSNRNYRQVEWNSEIHHVAAQGGTPQRLLGALGSEAVSSPNGRLLAFTRGSCRLSREAYQGSANNDIWLYDRREDRYLQLTSSPYNDHQPRWQNDSTLLCLSVHRGRYNVQQWRLSANGAVRERRFRTNFSDEGVRHFTLAGEQLVMERGQQLYRQMGEEPAQAMNLSLRADYRFDPYTWENVSAKISDYALSPSGNYALSIRHGEVFVQALDAEKDRTVNISAHPFRERKVQWLNDSVALFNSDREGGQYDLYVAQSADAQKPQLWTSLKHQIRPLTRTDADESDFWLAPDGEQVVYRRGAQELVWARISAQGLSDEKVLIQDWSMPDDVTWSPDSRYLAYSRSNLNFNQEVYIHPLAEDEEPINVSMHPRRDYKPVWSADGSKLGFLSARDNGDMDVWFAWLRRADWLQTKADREEGLYFAPEQPKTKKEDKKDEKPTVEPLQIDRDGLYRRLSQVTRLAGDERGLLISKDGETFYFAARDPASSSPDLYRAQYDGSEIKAVTTNGTNPRNLQWNAAQDKLYYLKGGSLYQLNPESGKSEKMSSNARLQIDKKQEQRQVFHEMWKALNDRFYDPQFHGIAWDSLRKVHQPRIFSASTRQDFADMINLMLGQVNASHMGYYSSGEEDTQSERTGLIGVELKAGEEGLRVSYVLPEGPANRPHSDLKVGELILSVNGQVIGEQDNFYELLNEQAGKQVLLQVQAEDDGSTREVVIRPATSLRSELYEAWVADRQALTKKYSQGRLGYIHVRGMDMASFERFERELTASGTGMEGIVIDVRFNGGGWTTDYLMAVLNVRQHAYTIPRGATDNLAQNHPKFQEFYPYSERLPLAWWTKPSVALCNESSYSNAEIFSHAYKTLDLGTLVGQPTFGAVISTGGTGFMDGSFVRLPFRAWYVKATGQNMEREPAVPDVLLKNPPNYRATGEDEQLRKAVEILLEQL